MSGHSKWSTIKRKKGALDAKRGKLFTKIIKEIAIAVKEGGSADPLNNPRLRLAIQNAKGANMPKDNVERTIKKAAGADASHYEEVTYEGYASHGVAVFVECLTDNINRTVSAVRALFNKYGGSLGTKGSLEFIFDRKGIFTLKIPSNFNEEEFELSMIDAGAEDIEIDENYITITSQTKDFGKVNKKLEEMGIETETAELQRIPKTTVPLSDETLIQVMKFVEALEDNDDVQKVYHNIEIKESQIALL
ncbi:MAG TPA: YebC/PmpR family DNA-binding transcriptional regulator [Cyclobacteriaceae bacterium]|nr:YebC/PmpR family DNA-binding transcriptional regulator [Cyclobacteriaceae bacterium]